MSFKVKVQPTGHQFEVEAHESILEAGLRAGLNLDYQCTNGTCGKCRARLLDGRVEPTRFTDFCFSEAELTQGWLLPCSSTPVTDVEIEAHESGRAAEIPEQQIRARVGRLDRLQDEVMLLQVRTPRSRSLRYLAGQSVALQFDDMRRVLPIASCPCHGTLLRFHVRWRPGDPFSEHVFSDLRRGREVLLTGPCGDFTLDESSGRPLLFVAWETGFAPVESIIDHAIRLHAERRMHLYWLSAIPGGHYLSNYCRAWEDALDDFHYHSIDLRPAGPGRLEAVCERILERHAPMEDWDVYLVLPEDAEADCRRRLGRAGLPVEQMHTKVVKSA